MQFINNQLNLNACRRFTRLLSKALCTPASTRMLSRRAFGRLLGVKTPHTYRSSLSTTATCPPMWCSCMATTPLITRSVPCSNQCVMHANLFCMIVVNGAYACAYCPSPPPEPVLCQSMLSPTHFRCVWQPMICRLRCLGMLDAMSFLVCA